MDEDTVFLLVMLAGFLFAFWLLWKSMAGQPFPLDGIADYAPPPPEPAAPAVPVVLRDFGRHVNPLWEFNKGCSGKFKQVNARTWQCSVCLLLRFEKEA